VVAIVQPAAGASIDERDLIGVCESRIARYKFPKAFFFVDKIVRSPVGKADYRWAKGVAAGTYAVNTQPTEASSHA